MPGNLNAKVPYGKNGVSRVLCELPMFCAGARREFGALLQGELPPGLVHSEAGPRIWLVLI